MELIKDYDLVIYLDVSMGDYKSRIANRNDAPEEDQDVNLLSKRIEIYENETLPVIEKFSSSDPSMFFKVDANLSEEEVFKSICKEIRKIFKNTFT